MVRFLSSALLVSLMPLFVRAADGEVPPPADVSAWGMVIFLIVFVGMIVGFGVFIWYQERARKQNKQGS